MSHPNDRIKSRRQALGLSQSELAARLGYTDRSTIAKIERGVNDINQSKLEAFAAALETTGAYLMGWTEDSYDYNRDPEDRRSQIPQEALTLLLRKHHGDFYGVWKDWQETQNSKTASPGRAISQEEIKFALFGGDGEITDEMFEEVRQFAAFVKSREARRKQE